MAKIKSCGFLIFRNDPNLSFLMMKHHDRWDLPKGHVDKGETKLECAFRELEEETGITADDIQMDEHFKFKLKYLVKGKRYGNNGPYEKKLFIYLAELIRPVDILVTEHAGYEWFDWNPPHDIQAKTINPLMEVLEEYWSENAPTLLQDKRRTKLAQPADEDAA